MPRSLGDDLRGSAWWGPYVSVLALGVLVGLLVLLFVVANGAEILRTFRSAMG